MHQLFVICNVAGYLIRQTFAIVVTVLFISIFAGFIHATEESPSRILTDEQVDTLFESLANAPTQLDGQLAENAIWQNWFNQAPTVEARGLLDSAIERREAYDFEASEQILDKLIKLAPDYAEGYNQRAFIRFLRENFDGSKADLEVTLKMKPNHFAAWAGLYQVYIRTGEQEKAWDNLIKAVTLHPWLKERAALPKAMWPNHYRKIHEPGQDI